MPVPRGTIRERLRGRSSTDFYSKCLFSVLLLFDPDGVVASFFGLGVTDV